MLSTLLLPLLMGVQHPYNADIAPGLYTNEEQVYFEAEAGRTPPPWVGVRIIGTAYAQRIEQIDEFGDPVPGPVAGGRLSPGAVAGTISFTTAGGRQLHLRRARPFTCWVSVRRDADRAAGQADWSFDRSLALHDQGGRVLVTPEGAPPVVIRMRNVVWPPPSTNRPSLVLYVHRPESPDRAESYSWADPDARMIGINLRWVQASCTRTETAP